MFIIQLHHGDYLNLMQFIMLNLLMVNCLQFEQYYIQNSTYLDVNILRRLGLASFLYMIIFAGLEFTITFLVYNRFNWNR